MHGMHTNLIDVGVLLIISNNFKAAVLQITLENNKLRKYSKISLHIHIIVDLNQNIA